MYVSHAYMFYTIHVYFDELISSYSLITSFCVTGLEEPLMNPRTYSRRNLDQKWRFRVQVGTVASTVA